MLLRPGAALSVAVALMVPSAASPAASFEVSPFGALAGPSPGLVGGAPPGETISRPVFRPPVDAPVVDPFRLPDGPYAAGNRGLEYGTTPGEPVGAIGAGMVSFSGVVAGRGVVSVDHPSGLHSTYTGLIDRTVRRGDRVATGAIVGHADRRFHLGLLRGRTYLDPATFFGTGTARLVQNPSVSTG